MQRYPHENHGTGTYLVVFLPRSNQVVVHVLQESLLHLRVHVLEQWSAIIGEKSRVVERIRFNVCGK
jgi:hypothetical protein